MCITKRGWHVHKSWLPCDRKDWALIVAVVLNIVSMVLNISGMCW